MKDRDDFVSWALDHEYPIDAGADGSFNSLETASAWDAWQGALEHVRKPKIFFRPLSDRQLEIFIYLKGEYQKTGAFPTFRSTAEKFGIRVGQMHALMQSLIKRGYVKKVRHGQYLLLKERAC